MGAVKNLLVLYTGGTIGMLQTAAGLAPAGGFEARMREYLAGRADAPQVQWSLRELNADRQRQHATGQLAGHA